MYKFDVYILSDSSFRLRVIICLLIKLPVESVVDSMLVPILSNVFIAYILIEIVIVAILSYAGTVLDDTNRSS